MTQTQHTPGALPDETPAEELKRLRNKTDRLEKKADALLSDREELIAALAEGLLLIAIYADTNEAVDLFHKRAAALLSRMEARP